MKLLKYYDRLIHGRRTGDPTLALVVGSAVLIALLAVFCPGYA